MHMGKASTGSNVGTGGMNTKMIAAKIATSSDVDMIIANSKDIGVLHRLLSGENEGTLFVSHKDESFDQDCIGDQFKFMLNADYFAGYGVGSAKISDDTSTKRGIHYEYG